MNTKFSYVSNSLCDDMKVFPIFKLNDSKLTAYRNNLNQIIDFNRAKTETVLQLKRAACPHLQSSYKSAIDNELRSCIF